MTLVAEPTMPTEADRIASLSLFTPPAPAQTRTVVVSTMLANVLESLCEGKNNRAIGADWGICQDTVKTHMRRLLRALDARDRTHAAILVLSGEVQVRIKPSQGGISQREARWEQIHRTILTDLPAIAGSRL